MNSTILAAKGTFVNSEEVKIINLHHQPIKEGSLVMSEADFSLIYVTKDVEFRPIALYALEYGSETVYWDLFLKINSISNPFDIQQGDILMAPNSEFFRTVVLENGEAAEDIFRLVLLEINRARALRSGTNRTVTPKVNRTLDKTSTTDSLKITPTKISIDTDIEKSNQETRKDILGRALTSAVDRGNTTLAKQINKIINCSVER